MGTWAVSSFLLLHMTKEASLCISLGYRMKTERWVIDLCTSAAFIPTSKRCECPFIPHLHQTCHYPIKHFFCYLMGVERIAPLLLLFEFPLSAVGWTFFQKFSDQLGFFFGDLSLHIFTHFIVSFLFPFYY